MKLEDFKIGLEFRFDYPDSDLFRCTDIGTRTVVAIKIDPVIIAVKDGGATLFKKSIPKAEAEADGWFRGPPYGVGEIVFDEDDLDICVLDGDHHGDE